MTARPALILASLLAGAAMGTHYYGIVLVPARLRAEEGRQGLGQPKGEPGQERERSIPPEARDQPSHQRHPGNERQRPGPLCHGKSSPAPFIRDAIAKIRLHGRIKKILAENCQQQGNTKGGERGSECHKAHAHDK